MNDERSPRQTRKAAKRTNRRRKQAQAIADAEAGVTYADGTESVPTSLLKFGAYVLITIAWIVFLAIQGWGTVAFVLGFLFVGIPFSVAAWLKGRKGLSVFGLFIWPLAVIGAVRLARPFSWWFDRFYLPTSRAAAEHFLSKSSTSSARRSLTRLVGVMNDADLDAVAELYLGGHATEYLESEWSFGRGFKDDPLPGHYQGLFQFANVIDDAIPDSADPKTLGEYWSFIGVDPWEESDRWPPRNIDPDDRDERADQSPGEMRGEEPELDWFNEIPELLDIDQGELDALSEDDPVWQAVTTLWFEMTADLERGVGWSEVVDQLKWEEIKDLPFAERFTQARSNYQPISPDNPFRAENLP